MKVEIEAAPRWSRTMTWLAVAAAVWAVALLATVSVARLAGVEAPTCMMKRLTGLPCPTCGLTRGSLCFLRGRTLDGWRHNPFMFTAMGVAAGVAAVRVGLGRRVRVVMSRRERWVAAGAMVVAVMVNWAYIIRVVG